VTIKLVQYLQRSALWMCGYYLRVASDQGWHLIAENTVCISGSAKLLYWAEALTSLMMFALVQCTTVLFPPSLMLVLVWHTLL